MDEIAYGVVREYPLPPLNQYWGELKSAKGNQCLDSMGHTQGGTVETYYCHQQGGNQVCSTCSKKLYGGTTLAFIDWSLVDTH